MSLEGNKKVSIENYDRLLKWNGPYLGRCKCKELSVS